MMRTSRRPELDLRLYGEFNRTINMTASQLRRWHASALSKHASFDHIRAELPLLTRMKGTRAQEWTPKMWSKARRSLAFVKRHEEQMRRQGIRFGTGRMHVTEKRVIALLNWGRITPGVPLAKRFLSHGASSRRTSR